LAERRAWSGVGGRDERIVVLSVEDVARIAATVVADIHT
jgi:hypothetical protein